MEDDILNYLSSVMFRGTPCRYNSIKPNKKLGATFSKFFRCYKVLGLTVLYQYLSWKQFRIIRNRKIILLNIHGVPPKTLEVSDDFDIVFLNNSLIWYSDTYCLQFVCLCFDFIGLYSLYNKKITVYKHRRHVHLHCSSFGEIIDTLLQPFTFLIK